jgi:hypothetical protein
MWKCPKCREQVEDFYQVCWNCGTAPDGTEDPSFRRADDAAVAPPAKDPLACLRCERPMEYAGSKAFHEGARWGILGEIGELFVNKERFDIYVCQRCGRVEFFVDGIGQEFRPK